MSDTRRNEKYFHEGRTRRPRRVQEVPRVCHQCGEESPTQICDLCWEEGKDAD